MSFKLPSSQASGGEAVSEFTPSALDVEPPLASLSTSTEVAEDSILSSELGTGRVLAARPVVQDDALLQHVICSTFYRSSRDFARKAHGRLDKGACCCIFWRPVALILCVHIFCGSCLVVWLRDNHTCPTCRGDVGETRDRHFVLSLLDTFYSLSSNRKRHEDRSAQEKGRLDALYKPGQGGIDIALPESEEEELDEADKMIFSALARLQRRVQVTARMPYFILADARP
jgi:hypothetical protein